MPPPTPSHTLAITPFDGFSLCVGPASTSPPDLSPPFPLQVGKAWLSLARMYQAVGSSSREGSAAAAEALARAQAVFRQYAGGLDAPPPYAACDESFAYLMGRVRRQDASDQARRV
jgi:hypothetical protein